MRELFTKYKSSWGGGGPGAKNIYTGRKIIPYVCLL
jgi:hypothetical protein